MIPAALKIESDKHPFHSANCDFINVSVEDILDRNKDLKEVDLINEI